MGAHVSTHTEYLNFYYSVVRGGGGGGGAFSPERGGEWHATPSLGTPMLMTNKCTSSHILATGRACSGPRQEII